jgi:hypothetical protein
VKVIEHNSLETAPNFPVRVATGDSLLDWNRKSRAQGDVLAELLERPVFAYASEDSDLLAEYLDPGQYTVVVGNPPYITVADSARNQLYRTIYPMVCYRQYALTVPFAQRFFDLAKRSDEHGEGAGHVGQITGNAFMKREFGKHLIEKYFAHEIELTEVIDTSAAYIPGHGTPTVILIGRANYRRRSPQLRALLSVKGEPTTPEVPANGLVWRAIVDQIDQPDSESEWITSTNLPRNQLASYPWSLSGGGATGLMHSLEQNNRLRDCIESIGRTVVLGEDDAWLLPDPATARRLHESDYVEIFVTGENVRDFQVVSPPLARSPYRDSSHLEAIDDDSFLVKHLWPVRTSLRARVIFGLTMMDKGRHWYEYLENYPGRLRVPMSIVFVFVATHNHFVLDRGGKIFNRHAPVIKLSEGATEEEHLRLLGVLNSSTACFWLKQVSQPKGGTANSSGGGNRLSPEPWYERYEFTGTKLQEFPLPGAYPLERAREIDGLAQRLASVTPAAVAASGVPTRQRLKEAQAEYLHIRARMIALQEELDWEVYRLYGLLDEDLTTTEPPELKLGQRAFEIVLARRKVDTQWFARHGSTPITELPEHWSDEYKRLIERRIAAIESDRNIGLIERPECKRRWSTDGWDAMQTAALRDWLLDRLEAPELWGAAAIPMSVAQLADKIRHDEDFRSVLDLWVGHEDYDLTRTLGTLVAEEHVPYLPAQRYKPSGLRKRAQWERTWALQRREDAGQSVKIEVPPKYASADFVKASYWRARGKLDVPKERFISYPKAGRDGDGIELLGWAGWDHLAQAQALAAVYLDRRTAAGWPADRLLPLLAGLAELEPWLHQWHADERPDFPGTPAGFFTEFIDGELTRLGADRSALTRLRGVEPLPV